ncbi:MAG: hypothetical protein ACRERD_01135, partial [Candidatus Binatia bacterium]
QELIDAQYRPGSVTIFARDVYSFWQPLDQQFLRVMTHLAHFKQFEYVSPFWSRNFFAYLEYDESTSDLEPGELFYLIDEAAYHNMLFNVYSPTGHYYRELLKGERTLYLPVVELR